MITREGFLNLDPAVNRVMDANGRTYRVVYNEPASPHPDVPGPREIVLEDEDDGHRWTLGWDTTTGKIMDDEFAIVMELNDDRAQIIVK
jgi:hypothetical protein